MFGSKIAAIAVGIVLAVVAGIVVVNVLNVEEESLPDLAAGSTQPAGDEGPGGSEGTSPEYESESSTTQSSTPGATAPFTLVVIPESLVLDSATATIRGLGQDATFYTGARPARFPEEVVEYGPGEGTCFVTGPLVIYWSGEAESVEFQMETFGAGFRVDNNNHVSIQAARDESGDIVVVGGYSYGSEGRGNSDQWSVQFGDLELAWQIAPLNDGPLVTLSVVATWTGESIENFSGEESSGRIDITCTFLEIPVPTG